MYVAKINRNKIIWQATLIEKKWSDDISSHYIVDSSNKAFLLKRNAINWINREIAKILMAKRELEFIDG